MLCPMAFEQLDPRPLSLACYPVARAFALSLLLHFVVIVGIELGYQANFWKTTFLFGRKAMEIDPAQFQQPQEQEMPLVFVDVDPSQATPEPPKDAKYYSALNSRAANPEPQRDTLVPKIEGKQDRVPQTMDRARPDPEPIPPSPPPPTPKTAETKPEPPPSPQTPAPPPPSVETEPEPPASKTGELAMAKPADKPPEPPKPRPVERFDTAPPARQRPRKLADARRDKGLAGERMRQPGGVKRFALEPSLDVRATPFGSYDAAIIAAIQRRWYDLLEARDFAANYSGKVILEFRLNSDGRVTEMKVSENSVTDILALLCQRAVQDPAPFAPWPADLRRLVGRDYREVRFTFYYN